MSQDEPADVPTGEYRRDAGKTRTGKELDTTDRYIAMNESVASDLQLIELTIYIYLDPVINR